MIVFTETITKALNEGYEVSLREAKTIGPRVLEITLRKDTFKYRHYLDTVLISTDALPEFIDHCIRYGMHDIKNLEQSHEYFENHEGTKPMEEFE